MGIVRRTKSVETLLGVFEQSEKAISVVDLVSQLQKEMNKTTVYRILDKLEKDGIVHSFLGKEGLKWYAKCQGCSSGHHVDAHPHFQCNNCGTIECLSLDVKIPTVKNYQISSVEIMLQGTCAQCSA
ncbi:Fur family transcriptional regulator [Pseudotenacibaculum haliotis]|uniref:Fur family transcriptional regulator n=1 Tax=Pseudotenacibaculum haliotis TaxID=1862138 RepID=A0ABW5LUS6_9FLAO